MDDRKDISRRDFFKVAAAGLGGLALAKLTSEEGHNEMLVQNSIAQILARPNENGWNFSVHTSLNKPIDSEIELMRVPITKKSVAGAMGGERIGSVQKEYDENSRTWVEKKMIVDPVNQRETMLMPDWEKATVLSRGNGNYSMPDLGGDMMYVFALVDNKGFDPLTSKWQMFTTPERNREGQDNFIYDTLIEIR